jgi:hypothetical protein
VDRIKYCSFKIIMMVFGNRVVRRIFGPKREKMEGDWSRLHNEELLNLYKYY